MKQRGVTLLEILIVIVIILTLVGLTSFILSSDQFTKAHDAQRKIIIDRIRTSLFDYYTDFNCFPKTIPDCHNLNSYPNKEYFSSYQCDPNGQNFIYEPENVDCPSSFEIYTILENKSDPDIIKTNCVSGCGPGCKYNYSIGGNNTVPFHTCPATEF